MKKKPAFLMCPPEYFDVSYIINPWMQGNVRRIDNALAKQQWRALYDILTDHAVVRLVLPQPGSPDMVFTANAGLVKGRRFLASRFRYPERQYEEPYFADWFLDRGYDVSLMPRHVPFEGAGDALLDRGAPRLWLAYGHRSVLAAKDVIAENFGGEIVPLKLTDQRFYHLDTCFCVLSGGEVLWHPAAFSPEAAATVRRSGGAGMLIEATEDDAMHLGVNSVCLGRDVVMCHASARTREALEARGYRVHVVPLDSFNRSGGAAYCLTLRLDNTTGAQRTRRNAEFEELRRAA